MLYKSIHRIIALTLAFVMFFTSVGFSIDLHYCGGKLKSFSLVNEASTCHSAVKVCPNHPNMVVVDQQKKDCCSNKTIQVDDLDKDFTYAADLDLTNIQTQFLTAFACVILQQQRISTIVKSTFVENADPLPPRDIYVLLESYLL